MSYYNGMSDAELADDLGFVWSRKAGGYVDPDEFCSECGGGLSRNTFGADFDCECDQEKETCTVKVVIARKDRKNGCIRKGDKIRVTSGFTYIVDGPRTGYFRNEVLLERGPAWYTDKGTLRVTVESPFNQPSRTFEVDDVFRDNPDEVRKAVQLVLKANRCRYNRPYWTTKDDGGSVTVVGYGYLDCCAQSQERTDAFLAQIRPVTA